MHKQNYKDASGQDRRLGQRSRLDPVKEALPMPPSWTAARWLSNEVLKLLVWAPAPTPLQQGPPRVGAVKPRQQASMPACDCCCFEVRTTGIRLVSLCAVRICPSYSEPAIL